MKITTNQAEVEKQLHRHLKFIGILLIAFALIAILWDFLPFVENEMDQILIDLEELPKPISPYIISSSFAFVGLSCLLLYWKKK